MFLVEHSDCLEALPNLQPSSFDVAIADPPYIIGGTSVSNARTKSGTWADMMNAASWYRDWLELCVRALKPTSYLLVFGNWRSLPTYLRAASMVEALFPASCMVWNKAWPGPSHRRALRPAWEAVLWLAMPEAEIPDRGAQDVITVKWHGNKAETEHPAEKPRVLLAQLLRLAAPKGGRVLDPFCGSAAAGLAALDLGMDYHGIEAEERWVELARQSLALHVKQETFDYNVEELR